MYMCEWWFIYMSMSDLGMTYIWWLSAHTSFPSCKHETWYYANWVFPFPASCWRDPHTQNSDAYTHAYTHSQHHPHCASTACPSNCHCTDSSGFLSSSLCLDWQMYMEAATWNSSQVCSSSLCAIPMMSIIPVMSVSHVLLSPYVLQCGALWHHVD